MRKLLLSLLILGSFAQSMTAFAQETEGSTATSDWDVCVTNVLYCPAMYKDVYDNNNPIANFFGQQWFGRDLGVHRPDGASCECITEKGTFSGRLVNLRNK